MRFRFFKNAPAFLKTGPVLSRLSKTHERVMSSGMRFRYEAELRRLGPQIDEAKRLMKAAVFDLEIDDLDMGIEIEEAFENLCEDERMKDVIEYVLRNSDVRQYAGRLREFTLNFQTIQGRARHGVRGSLKRRQDSICARAAILCRNANLKNPPPEIISRLALAEIWERLRRATVADPDLAAAWLHHEYPWMRAANAAFLDDARRPGPFRMRAIILAGNPGSGKTSWAGDMARAAGTSLIRVDLSGSGGGLFELQGQEAGWSGSQPGAVVRGIASTLCVNPVVVVEEIDMGQGWTASSGKSLPGAAAALMSMIEPETAKAWRCPSTGAILDLRGITWVMTTNHPEKLPEPLLDRCHIVNVPQLSEEEIETAAHRVAEERVPGSGDAVVASIRERRKAGRPVRTLRSVRKMIDMLEVVSNRPTFH